MKNIKKNSESNFNQLCIHQVDLQCFTNFRVILEFSHHKKDLPIDKNIAISVIDGYFYIDRVH